MPNLNWIEILGGKFGGKFKNIFVERVEDESSDQHTLKVRSLSKEIKLDRNLLETLLVEVLVLDKRESKKYIKEQSVKDAQQIRVTKEENGEIFINVPKGKYCSDIAKKWLNKVDKSCSQKMI